MNKKLSELVQGQKAIIKSFTNNSIQLKLMEMGCLPEEKITITQVAPMGGPISITVSDYQLSLRRDEAEKIIVQLID
jgi:ferrous iron transport protein A